MVESNHAGFTGTGFVNGENVIGSGANTIRALATTVNGGPNLDRLTV